LILGSPEGFLGPRKGFWVPGRVFGSPEGVLGSLEGFWGSLEGFLDLGGQIRCPPTILFKSAKLGFLQVKGVLSPNNCSKRMCFSCKFRCQGLSNQRGICHGLVYFE